MKPLIHPYVRSRITIVSYIHRPTSVLPLKTMQAKRPLTGGDDWGNSGGKDRCTLADLSGMRGGQTGERTFIPPWCPRTTVNPKRRAVGKFRNWRAARRALDRGDGTFPVSAAGGVA